MGCFRGDHPLGFVFLKVNPIANKLLGALKTPLQLHTNDSTCAKIAEARSVGSARNQKEAMVLNLVREHVYRQVAIKLTHGEIVGATTETEFGGPGREVTDDEVRRIIRSERFQSVTFTRVDGGVVRVTQSVALPMRNSPAPKGAAPMPQKGPDRRGGYRSKK